MKKPLEQFELFFVNNTLSNLFEIFLTNYFYTLFLVFSSLVFIFYINNHLKTFFLDDLQTIFYTLYMFILNILEEQTGSVAQRFFPFVFTVFLFILFFNVFALVPATFSITGQLFTTFILGLTVLIGITLYGISIKGIRFFLIFVPKDVPVFLKPFLILIEVISYISRAFSLSIRLFANLMSGHILLNILSSFCIKLFYSTIFFSFFPFIVTLLVFTLEVGIAFLQAYVFCVLFCIYFNDCF